MSQHAPNPSAGFMPVGSRRVKRIEETQEIQIRTSHRRRKVLTRGGVLMGFGLVMVAYPMVGTLNPAPSAVEGLPGVVVGEATTTTRALLGTGPQLLPSVLAVTEPDEIAHFLAVSNEFIVSTVLPDCDGSTEWEGTNGQLTEDSLCFLWDGRNKVRSDAAVELARLNEAFKLEFGRNMCIISSYRTLREQYVIKASKGYLAATPGKSYHGWGLAVDLCDGDDRGATKEWLDNNGPIYGWANPNWASTRKWEPWHFEYVPGTDEIGWGYGEDLTEEIGDGGTSTVVPPVVEVPDPVITDPAAGTGSNFGGTGGTGGTTGTGTTTP